MNEPEFPWERDLYHKLTVDIDALDADELRAELREMRVFAFELCNVVRMFASSSAHRREVSKPSYH
jgi:hypothetical protein